MPLAVLFASSSSLTTAKAIGEPGVKPSFGVRGGDTLGDATQYFVSALLLLRGKKSYIPDLLTSTSEELEFAGEGAGSFPT